MTDAKPLSDDLLIQAEELAQWLFANRPPWDDDGTGALRYGMLIGHALKLVETLRELDAKIDYLRARDKEAMEILAIEKKQHQWLLNTLRELDAKIDYLNGALDARDEKIREYIDDKNFAGDRYIAVRQAMRALYAQIVEGQQVMRERCAQLCKGVGQPELAKRIRELK